MHLDTLAAARRHEHRFDDGNPLAERNTRRALWLTVGMMLVEIVGGWWFNSMAVLADGWHMSSHALALGLSVFAYRCARRYAHDPRFAFGTWKIEILAGYTSAIALLGVAALMAVQSLQRLWVPAPIHYNEAIAIAAVGLGVNLLCAWWLHDSPGHAHHHHGHGHDHGQHHGHDHDHHDHNDHAHGHDLNLRSAYVHVLADAATSVLAIVALLGGKLLGLTWLDPVMGLVGAVLVTVWAIGLLRDSGRILLDAQMDAPVVAEVRDVIEQAHRVFNEGREVDIQTLERTFSIRANDVFIGSYGGRLRDVFREHAPGCTLRFMPEGDTDDDAMVQGRIDLYISTAGKHTQETKVQNLFTTALLGAARKDHPLFDGDITAERFAACDHIAVSRRGIAHGPIDDELAQLGLQRRVAMVIPTFHGAIFAAAASDLVLPQMPSVMLDRIAYMGLPLRMFPLPVPVRTVALVQAWHPRMDNDPAHRWLRRAIKSMCDADAV
ncbi:hypothetical protein G6F65_012147 [Rhizopus arrhizus]|nr:hypothetical protein G6F65_012147 [Rhizopus arrhizus]